MIRLLLILGLFFALVGCTEGASSEWLFFDFESDSELDRFYWKCHTLFSLSDEHVSHGERSLKLELYPSNYPGLEPLLDKNDWKNHKWLSFDVYNPQRGEIQLNVRLDDQENYPDYPDRFNKVINLKPGMNSLKIQLDTLVTSGTERHLDLNNIYRMFIFLVRPERKMILYVDYVRLEA
jgi:hypothetical protein